MNTFAQFSKVERYSNLLQTHLKGLNVFSIFSSVNEGFNSCNNHEINEALQSVCFHRTLSSSKCLIGNILMFLNPV